MVEYTPGPEPGDWRRTLPGYIPPLLPQWRYVEPFAIEAADQYRPEPPPELNSQRYADSVDQVMQLGRLDSDIRTEHQSEIAMFWADGGGTFTTPGHWNQIAADVALTEGTSLVVVVHLGHAEVDYFYDCLVVVHRDQQVAGFYISIVHSFLMSVLNRFAHVDEQYDALTKAQLLPICSSTV